MLLALIEIQNMIIMVYLGFFKMKGESPYCYPHIRETQWSIILKGINYSNNLTLVYNILVLFHHQYTTYIHSFSPYRNLFDTKCVRMNSARYAWDILITLLFKHPPCNFRDGNTGWAGLPLARQKRAGPTPPCFENRLLKCIPSHWWVGGLARFGGLTGPKASWPTSATPKKNKKY